MFLWCSSNVSAKYIFPVLGSLMKYILCAALLLLSVALLVSCEGAPAETGADESTQAQQEPDFVLSGEGAPEYTGRLCVIGSKMDEAKIAELFGL